MQDLQILVNTALENAVQNGIDSDSLSTFLPVVGSKYNESNGILIYGRCPNGHDANSAPSLKSLVEKNRSHFIRAISAISKLYYDDKYGDCLIYSNVFKVCDIDAGNPSPKLIRSQYDIMCDVCSLEQAMFQPLVTILMTGQTFSQEEWDGPFWDGVLNCMAYDELDQVQYKCPNDKLWTAKIYEAKGRFYIITDRPEGHPLDWTIGAIQTLIDRHTPLHSRKAQ